MSSKLTDQLDAAETQKEILKKPLFTPGHEGLIVLAVGLRWAWWAANAPDHAGTVADWIELVKSVNAVLEKVVLTMRYAVLLFRPTN